jgi:hypothetical protein
MQKRNWSHEIHGTPCTITLIWGECPGEHWHRDSGVVNGLRKRRG